jgi:hypothetical protein
MSFRVYRKVRPVILYKMGSVKGIVNKTHRHDSESGQDSGYQERVSLRLARFPCYNYRTEIAFCNKVLQFSIAFSNSILTVFFAKNSNPNIYNCIYKIDGALLSGMNIACTLS